LRKVFKKFLMSGEERLFEGLSRHVDLSIKSLAVIEELLKGGVSGHRVSSLIVDVITFEKQGDKIATSLTDMVTQGAIPVALLGDMEFLIDRVDDILDLAYFVAMEYGRAFRAGISGSDQVKVLYKEILKMVAVALKALETLKQEFTVALKDFNKLQELDDIIDVYEDRVDDMKNSALDMLYGLGKDVDAITFNHLSEMIRSLDTIVDACEDASHLLIRIISSMRY